MPEIDKECQGPGATHFACSCFLERLKRYEEVLRFYAEKAMIPIDAEDPYGDKLFELDAGERARQALEGK